MFIQATSSPGFNAPCTHRCSQRYYIPTSEAIESLVQCIVDSGAKA